MSRSHNARCYVKKLKRDDAKGTKRLDVLFKQAVMDSSLDPAKKPKPDNSASVRCDISEHEIENQPSPPASCIKQPSLDINDSSDESSDEDRSVHVPDARLFTSGKYEARHNWLYFSAAKGAYRCKVCEVFGSVNDINQHSFASGIRSLGSHPSRKLLKHEKSTEHCKALQKQSGSKSFKDISIPTVLSLIKGAAQKQNESEITRNRKYFAILIQTVFYTVRRKWALDSLESLMDHMCKMGNLDIQNYVERNPQRKYTSSTSISEVVGSIDRYIEEETLRQVRKGRVYSLMADESSDESHREQFAIIIRLKTEDGNVDDHFLGITEVKRQDAASLMAAIEDFLLRKEIDIKRAIFVGFDGCNTMSGENKGLQRRFRHVVPHQLYINCRNHKLALCLKHLIKDYPTIENVDSLLLSIWKLFHYSPTKYAIFQSIQESYGLAKLKFIRAATTRWLSHGRSCLRLVDRYEQVLDALDACLDRKYEAEVFGLRNQLLDKPTVAMVLILCDLLKPVIRFSDYLQGQNIFSNMQMKCDELIDQLHHLITRFSTSLDRPDTDLYFSKMSTLFQIIDERNALGRQLRGPAMMTSRQVVDEVAKPVTYALINEISDAFHCAPVLSAFSIFNMDKVPETMTDIAVYGNQEMETLSSHYGRAKEDIFQGHRTVSEPIFSEAELKAEFRGFKHQMCIHKQRGNLDTKTLFEDQVIVNSFPAMQHMVDLSRIIPSSTACVERLFSLLNSLCTPSRSSLGQIKLESLIRICSFKRTELLEHQIQEIINIFKNEKTRDIFL